MHCYLYAPAVGLSFCPQRVFLCLFLLLSYQSRRYGLFLLLQPSLALLLAWTEFLFIVLLSRARYRPFFDAVFSVVPLDDPLMLLSTSPLRLL